VNGSDPLHTRLLKETKEKLYGIKDIENTHLDANNKTIKDDVATSNRFRGVCR